MLVCEAGKVESYLTRCLEVASLDKPRYPTRFSKGGSMVWEGSAQYKLIQIRQQLRPEQLAALSKQQRQLLDYLTTPDQEGFYPREKDAFRESGGGGIGMALGILRLVEDPSYILELKQRIEMGLAEPANFTTDQLSMMVSVLEQINAGVPLRSQKASTMGWEAFCTELKVPPHRGRELDKKLRRMYQLGDK